MKNSKSILKINRQKSFWILTSTLVFLVLVYIGLVHASIYNTVSQKDAGDEMGKIRGEMVGMEEEYMNITDGLLSDASVTPNFNVLSTKDVHFVDARHSGLTVNDVRN